MEEEEIEYIGKKRLKKKLADASDASIWRWVKSGRLPKPRQIGPNRVAWLRHEVDAALQKFPVAESKPTAPTAPSGRRGRKPKADVGITEG